MNVLSLSRTGDDRYVGASGKAGFRLKSCKAAIWQVLAGADIQKAGSERRQLVGIPPAPPPSLEYDAAFWDKPAVRE